MVKNWQNVKSFSQASDWFFWLIFSEFATHQIEFWWVGLLPKIQFPLESTWGGCGGKGGEGKSRKKVKTVRDLYLDFQGGSEECSALDTQSRGGQWFAFPQIPGLWEDWELRLWNWFYLFLGKMKEHFCLVAIGLLVTICRGAGPKGEKGPWGPVPLVFLDNGVQLWRVLLLMKAETGDPFLLEHGM
jgi:hypothetical protein